MTATCTTFIDPSAQAADSRADALERDTLGHVWRDQPLQPWNKRREILFLALEKRVQVSDDFVEQAANSLDELEIVEKRVAAVLAKERAENPTADLPSPESLVNWHSFLASAARVLWLAHHAADDWLHLRAAPDAWLQQIEDWADDMVEAHEIIAAVHLAHLLRTEHQQFITLPRPEKQDGKIASGN